MVVKKNLFTPYFGSRRDFRMYMQVSAKDEKVIAPRVLGYKGVIKDQLTGNKWMIYGVPCDSEGCVCAAEAYPYDINKVKGAK